MREKKNTYTHICVYIFKTPHMYVQNIILLYTWEVCGVVSPACIHLLHFKLIKGAEYECKWFLFVWNKFNCSERYTIMAFSGTI